MPIQSIIAEGLGEMTEEQGRIYSQGLLAGKLGALEDRFNRHETWIGVEMQNINKKLDELAANMHLSAGSSRVSNGLWIIVATVAASVTAGLALHLMGLKS